MTLRQQLQGKVHFYVEDTYEAAISSEDMDENSVFSEQQGVQEDDLWLDEELPY